MSPKAQSTLLLISAHADEDAVALEWGVVPLLEGASLQGKVRPACKDGCCSSFTGAAICSCATWPGWLVEEGSRDLVPQAV